MTRWLISRSSKAHEIFVLTGDDRPAEGAQDQEAPPHDSVDHRRVASACDQSSTTGSRAGQSFSRALRVHRLPDGEIPVELDVCVWSCEGLRPCCRIDDLAVDHFDEALAAPQIFGQGGGRSRCIGSDSHFAADRSVVAGVSEQSPPPGLRSRGHFLSRLRLRRIEPHLRLLRASAAATG